ncbi:unnamed protein product [Rodentolepis nana]|uniref:Uncharacterized protein n=1 Tax=Rodentolepis nana TaxID=102285 RepID=A0A0R3TJ86_RODNA|nr:unnamed protein product [Rodentolepis nana]
MSWSILVGAEELIHVNAQIKAFSLIREPIDVFPVTWSIASMGVGPSCNYEWEHIVVLPVTRSMATTYCGASCN